MEAETYLADGYGVRLSIEAKSSGWVRFATLASASAPPRIKQILVTPEHGTPYLNTSQVFDPRPSPRKWLAMSKTIKGASRLVDEGTILVMASATVGRSIVATKAHEGAIVSHHFMRVKPVRPEMAGWVYAFLRSPQGQAMMKGSQYASVIRHIEPAHLAKLPIPTVSEQLAKDFHDKVRSIVARRNNAAKFTAQAEQLFADSIGFREAKDIPAGFAVRLSDLAKRRRRLEGNYHDPRVRAIIASFGSAEPLGQITKRVWWPNRFKRIYGDSGTPYMSADDVFTTNPYALKSVLVEGKKDLDEFLVESDWIVMSRSGQTYGLNGSAKLLSDYHKAFFLSDDLIRISPDPAKARPGYLLTALTHPKLGRPLVIREAYGMSIPHLDPSDVAAIPIARLARNVEDSIADFAEEAASEQALAESMERDLAEDAGRVISEFLLAPAA